MSEQRGERPPSRSAVEASSVARSARPWVLTFALLGSGLAWAGHLAVTYAAVPTLCALELEVLHYLFTLAFFALALAAGLVGLALAVRSGSGGRPEGTAHGRAAREVDRYLGGAAIVLAVMFATAIVFQGAPAISIDPCTVVP